MAFMDSAAALFCRHMKCRSCTGPWLHHVTYKIHAAVAIFPPPPSPHLPSPVSPLNQHVSLCITKPNPGHSGCSSLRESRWQHRCASYRGRQTRREPPELLTAECRRDAARREVAKLSSHSCDCERISAMSGPSFLTLTRSPLSLLSWPL
jgi:hypothetical protein